MLLSISQSNFENEFIKPFSLTYMVKGHNQEIMKAYRTVKDGLAVVLVLEKDDDLCDGLVGAVRGGYE
jgi:hypothetical protein